MSTLAPRLLAALLLALVAGGPAAAQPTAPMDVQHFQPHADGRGWLATESPRTLQLWQPAFGVWTHYGRDPYAYWVDGELDRRLLGDLWTLDLQAAIGFGVADLAIDMPLHLVAAGEEVDSGEPWQTTAPGDLRIAPKLRFLDPEVRGIGLGLALPLTVPTGDEQRFVGWPTVTFVPTVLVAGHVGPVRLGANLGARIQRGEPVDGLVIGSAFVFRGAVAVDAHHALTLQAEVFGDVRAGERANPVEWLAGVTFRPAPPLAITLAGGTALGPGLGAPQSRVVLGVGVTIPRRRDDAPVVAEAAPATRTLTATLPPGAAVDLPHPYCACLTPAGGTLRAEIPLAVDHVVVRADGYEPLTVPLPSGGGPAALGALDLIPVPPTGVLSLVVRDPEGRPLAAELLLDSREEVTAVDPAGLALRLPAGGHTAHLAADGHRPGSIPFRVDTGAMTYLRGVLQPISVTFPERIYFEVGEATLDATDEATIGAVAERLAAYPQVSRVQIVGRADPRGTAEDNRALCTARAGAVRDRLAALGVDAARMELRVEPPSAEEQELAHGVQEMAEMRRVEFRVLAEPEEGDDR